MGFSALRQLSLGGTTYTYVLSVLSICHPSVSTGGVASLACPMASTLPVPYLNSADVVSTGADYYGKTVVKPSKVRFPPKPRACT